MKQGAENRKKTIAAGALGTVALICLFYMYNALFGGSSAPTPPPSVVPAAKPAATAAPAVVRSTPAGSTPAAAPGASAKRLASTSAGLDPTLDETAMLRTESLVYSGSGRNVFSATYTPPPPPVPKNVPSARPIVTAPPVPTGPPPPPPPPPINLKFFGTVKHGGAPLQAFLLSGDDVYLASAGDIVVRKYKIVSISANSISVTDLQNNNTQTLPLQMN